MFRQTIDGVAQNGLWNIVLSRKLREVQFDIVHPHSYQFVYDDFVGAIF